VFAAALEAVYSASVDGTRVLTQTAVKPK